MRIYFDHFLENIRGKFWVIPLLCLFFAALFAAVNLFLDSTLNSGRLFSDDIYKLFKHSDSVNTLLSTTATAVLGVAGVAFSITIASLTLASQQFGPRLLRNFLLDRLNQIVIGFFIATFLYCVLLLQFSSAVLDHENIPIISISWLLIIIVVDLLLLVFFIHHTATAIQADNIIADVYKDLLEHLDRIFPEDTENPKKQEQCDNKLNQEGHEIIIETSGYLRAIDIERLLKVVEKNDWILRVNYHPGNFITEGCALATCLNLDTLDEKDQNEINKHFLMGNVRTPEQDVEFAIHQLVEVALRALSPSINDPFTAITCIHWLGNAIASLLNRDFPPEYRFDEEGNLRLQLKQFTFKGMLDAAFNQIRQYSANNVAVALVLLETLSTLGEQAQNYSRAFAIVEQINATYQSAKKLTEDKHDLAVLDKYQKRARGILARFSK